MWRIATDNSRERGKKRRILPIRSPVRDLAEKERTRACITVFLLFMRLFFTRRAIQCINSHWRLEVIAVSDEEKH